MSKKKYSENLTTDIGGFSISLIFGQSPVEEERKTSGDGVQDRLTLRVHHGCIPDFKERKKLFDSGETWSFFHSRGKYILQDESLDEGLAPQKLVILEPGFESGDIYLRNGKLDSISLTDPLLYPLNQILMILLLSCKKGIYLHACGIDDNGRGYLFLGNSTHGKSTMARLWSQEKALVLNDDRIILREQNGRFMMYGTPWHGDFDKFVLKPLPVQKIFFLKHGSKNLAIPKKGIEAVSMFITRCFPPIWDKEGMESTTDLSQRIVRKIPCYELNFVPDRKIINFIRDV